MTPIELEHFKNGAHISSADSLSIEVTTIRELIDRMAEARPEAFFLMSPEMGEVLTFLGLKEQSEVLSTNFSDGDWRGATKLPS